MTEERTITLEFKWSVSRGRDTYGYNICTLYADGERVARCNGGGYDMQGTVLGHFLARHFAERLLRLPGPPQPERVPCNRCGGTGKVPARCMICNGRGYIPESGDCPRCPGNGIDPEALEECSHCGGGGTVRNDEGAYYGLTFHDPDYDPGKAIVGVDTSNRTLGAEDGLTVAEAEAQGLSIGLERYQAIYAASSKWPTSRHRIPSIDGACGMSSVQRIGEAIGLTFEYMPVKSKNLTIFRLHVGEDPHA